jgi:hypothetical protein
MKTGSQLLRDFSRFAAFDARCRLQMAFSVKGEWKERKDGDKDYPSQPEMPHMRRIPNFKRNREWTSVVRPACSNWNTGRIANVGPLGLAHSPLFRGPWFGSTSLVRFPDAFVLLCGENTCFSGGLLHKLALLAFFAAIQMGTADPRIGSWTLISAQSSIAPADKLSISSQHGAVHVVISGETHLDFTAKLDGHDASVPANPAFNQIELRRINKHEVEVKEKKDGAVIATILDIIAKDGNELTSTTSQQGHPDKITVWMRSGGKRSANDLFVGEWTEDLSKTQMRQGMTLQIEPEGNGGVHFSGDFSYSARFDGKEYDLKNSRNDSVTLQLADPHTVDAIYRRGDQITQRDRWVVSPDGTHMTLTTTGTLESGQQIKETLLFRKQ